MAHLLQRIRLNVNRLQPGELTVGPHQDRVFIGLESAGVTWWAVMSQEEAERLAHEIAHTIGRIRAGYTFIGPPAAPFQLELGGEKP